mmetsp:Transcript_21118/g.38549  ORF Transcript_21118/g.38549 Transcript_21118/m.38549 type:complete len:252 (-) Transcript_21118:1968-2723(-)
MVSSNHQDHLDELCAVRWQLLPEPQKAQDATNANVLRKHIGDSHSCILELVAAVIRDRGDEVGGLADHAELLGPCVVHWHLRRLGLHKLNNLPFLNHLAVQSADCLRQLVERVWDDDASRLHGGVLRSCCLHVATCLCTSVAELDCSLEVGCHGAYTPCNDWLSDATTLDSLNHVILINAADFTQQEQNLCSGIILIPCEVVDEATTRISVTTNGDALVDTIGVAAHHVVQLIGHAAGLGHVRNGTWAVEP